MTLKPCTVGCPVPGFDADIFDDEGKPAKQGYLVIKKPWPSMTRGILKNRDKFMEIYWSKYKDTWYHGDVVSKDSDGLWYILGRADDIIKISGHRIGSSELEAADHIPSRGGRGYGDRSTGYAERTIDSCIYNLEKGVSKQ